MARLKLTRAAKADLVRIGAYTIENWGTDQAVRYLADLEDCAKMLAENPRLGRPCDWIRPGLKRFERGRHVLFYRELKSGIRVSRILHQNMIPDEDRLKDSPSID